jgi:hypothetical protein
MSVLPQPEGKGKHNPSLFRLLEGRNFSWKPKTDALPITYSNLSFYYIMSEGKNKPFFIEIYEGEV